MPSEVREVTIEEARKAADWLARDRYDGTFADAGAYALLCVFIEASTRRKQDGLAMVAASFEAAVSLALANPESATRADWYAQLISTLIPQDASNALTAMMDNARAAGHATGVAEERKRCLAEVGELRERRMMDKIIEASVSFSLGASTRGFLLALNHVERLIATTNAPIRKASKEKL